MISPLVVPHLDEESWNDCPIDKPDVPVFIFIDACTHIDGCSDLMDQLVLSVADVQNELWISIISLFLFCR